MKPAHPARILIVDDDPEYRGILMDLLKGLDYQVEAPEGTGLELVHQANLTGATFRPHVAIIDLDLCGESGKNNSGLDILKEMRVSANCILYSSYLTPARTRQAQALQAYTWVEKSEGPADLMTIVAEAAQARCCSKRQTLLNYPSSHPSTAILQKIGLDPAIAQIGLVDDVICACFVDHQMIILQTPDRDVTTPNPASRGQSVILIAFLDENQQALVLKLGPPGKIAEEARRYKDHINGKLGGEFHARIVEGSPSYFWDLGALVYSLLGEFSAQELPTFSEYYRGEPSHQEISKILDFLFKKVWGKLYEGKWETIKVSLYEAYLSYFVRMGEKLSAVGDQPEQIHFHGIPFPLPNLLSWVPQHHAGSQVPGARSLVTHGDLHGDNFFTDGTHAWAIDFERSGPGHSQRDFAELEMDILSRIVPEAELPLEDIFSIAVTLCAPKTLGASLPDFKDFSGAPEVYKALRVCQHLHQLAAEQTHRQDAMEYLWALLFDALFITTFNYQAGPQNPQTQRALLVGAVICQRLETWSGEWPPRAWAPFLESRAKLARKRLPPAGTGKEKGKDIIR